MYQPRSITIREDGLYYILWLINTGYLMWEDHGGDEFEVGEG